MKNVGSPVPHIHGNDIVTGGTQYVTDLKLPGMIHGRVLRSPIPHGMILNVDAQKALKIPGVKAVLTGENVSRNKFGTLLEDWEILATEKVRFVGDEVAAVAATTPDAAEEAIRNIVVDYEELPAVFDPGEAMAPGAPLIHERERNIAMTYQVERGDVQAGFREADLVYENTFSSPQIYHAYLEPNGCTAQYDHQGRLTLYLPTQTPSVTRVLYAKALGMPMDKLRLVIPPYGGAFGGKQASKLHLIAGLLAKEAGRPVHMAITRAEDFISGNPKVHLLIDVKIGAKRDGTLVAKEVRVVGGAGGRVVYAPIVTSTACSRVDSLYQFRNLKTVGYTVYTNTAPTAAFRGFGHPEALVAVESSLDMIAEGLGIDPVDLRLKNSIRQGETSIHGYKIRSCGLQECIRVATEKARYREKRNQPDTHRGVGMACCNHVSGNRLLFRDFDGSAAVIKLSRDGDVTLIHGESDMGQGQDTVLSQIAAEELGIRTSDIRVAGVDTDTSPFGLGSVSSRGTLFGGNAVKEAARDARRQILDMAGDILEADTGDLCLEDGKIFVRGAPQVSISFHQAVQAFCDRKGGMPIIGMGSYTPSTEIPDFKTMYGNISPAYPFACHVAEVEVDRDTGVVRVIRYTAAHDIGRAINPMLAEGQVQGGIAQGIGFTLMEEIRFDRGKMENPNFQDYIVPGPSDLPRMEVFFVETNDPEGPYGAKGVGEPALDPVPAAIVNAIYDAVGVRVTRLPITPERLRAAIRAKENHPIS